MIRILAPLLAVAWILSVVAWQLWVTPGTVALVMATTVINLGISYRFRARLGEAAHAAEDACHDLKLLSALLTAFENEEFTSPRLLQLQALTGDREIESGGRVSRIGAQPVRSRF
jgi:hypothetical protein